MKLAKSGSRGLFWRPDPRGAQEFTLPDGKRPAKGDARRGQRGAWWIRWTCPHGHLHRKPVGPKSAAQDESARHRLERPCPAREVKPVSHLLADVIRDYLAEVKSYKRSYRDDARYGKVWGERFAGRTLDEITAGEIEKIKTERLESVAPASVNREVGFLRHVFNVAIRDGKTERNPAARVRTLKEPSGRVRYLSDEEEDALLKALASDGDRQRVLMLVHTGLRKSEFLNLRWRDIDLRAGVLTIPRSKNGLTRHVPLNSIVRGILTRLPRPLDASALVFPNSAGGPDLRWAEKAFPEAVGAAKLDDFRLHDWPPHVRVTPGHGGRRSADPSGARRLAQLGDGRPIRAPVAGTSPERD